MADVWIAPTDSQRRTLAKQPGAWGNVSPLSAECFDHVAVTRGITVDDLTTPQLAFHIAALDAARATLDIRAQMARAALAKNLAV